MTLHLIKLCVGVDSHRRPRPMAGRPHQGAEEEGQEAELMHVTRMTPKRKDEMLDGGSLYWVIKGQIAVRQQLLALKPSDQERRAALRAGL